MPSWNRRGRLPQHAGRPPARRVQGAFPRTVGAGAVEAYETVSQSAFTGKVRRRIIVLIGGDGKIRA